MSRRIREPLLVSTGHPGPRSQDRADRRAGWNYDTSEIPVLQTGPVTTRDEQRFISGEITGDQYLHRAGGADAELRLLLAQKEKYRTRRFMVFFSATATVVYFATAVVFLVLESTGAAVLALLVSVAFLIALNLHQALLRVSSDGKRAL